ncbi:MAG TPA: hypothetical protein VLM91_02790 [Candidatus Methylomirabilis sp.]|nr:hypothetical protein [Candidatus Methylomirabilis sp.]
MNDRNKPRTFSILLTFFRAVVRLVRGLSLSPEQIALVPGPGRCQAAPRERQWTPPGQIVILPLLLSCILVAATPAGSRAAALPAGVPNIYDPDVLAHFQPAAVGNLRDNPDFPVLLLLNTIGEQPPALLLGLDARNGTDVWSLTTDPIILIMLLSDRTTIQGVYVDAGFVELGKASGNYAAVGGESLPALLDLLPAVSLPVKDAGMRLEHGPRIAGLRSPGGEF